MAYVSDSFGNTYWGIFDGSIIDLPHIRSNAIQGVIRDDTGGGFRTGGHNIVFDGSAGGGNYIRMWYTPDHPVETFTTDLGTATIDSSLATKSRLFTTVNPGSAYAGLQISTNSVEGGSNRVGQGNAIDYMGSFADGTSSSFTTFGVVGNGMIAMFQASYSVGNYLSNFRGFIAGYLVDPLFNSPGVYDYANMVVLIISSSNVGTYVRPTLNDTSTSQGLQVPNYSITCASGSVSGTYQATNFFAIDNNAAPEDYAIGSIPNVLFGIGTAFSIGRLYRITGVGQGQSNTNINTEQTLFLCVGNLTGNNRLLVRVASTNFT